MYNQTKGIHKIMTKLRLNGDKMIPLGMRGRKKLKDIFIDLKIPVEKRDEIPILCFDSEIAWIVEHRVSESFKITKETKNKIRVDYEGKLSLKERLSSRYAFMQYPFLSLLFCNT